MVDSPTQEILLFPDEVARVLGETADWADKNKESLLSKSEIKDIRQAAEEYK